MEAPHEVLEYTAMEYTARTESAIGTQYRSTCRALEYTAGVHNHGVHSWSTQRGTLRRSFACLTGFVEQLRGWILR